MKSLTVIVSVLLSALFLCVYAQEIDIVKNRKAQAQIIIGVKPTRAVQFAAFELQYVVKLMTGAELPIVARGSTGKYPIILGGAKPGEFKREAYSVSVTPERTVLKGNDSPDHGRVDYRNPYTYPKPSFNFHSTVYAVYDFLEYCAGVRFYAPGDLGIGMKKRPTLTVKPFERKYAPAEQALRYIEPYALAGMKIPKEFLMEGPDARKTPYWISKRLYQLRMRSNILYGFQNHNTYSLGFRYWGKARGFEDAFVEKRVEYFSRGWDIPRYDPHLSANFGPGNPLPAQVCTSHPDVVRHFAAEAVGLYTGKIQPGTFRKYPRMADCPFYYGFSWQDTAYWCRCSRCKVRFTDVPEKFRFNYLHYDFLNRLSREIKKINPNINVSGNAYNTYLRYPDPQKVKLDPGIGITMVLNRDQWPAKGRVYRWQHKAYQDWLKYERKNRALFTWEHMLSPPLHATRTYKYRYFPFNYPYDTARFYKQHVKNGLAGCSLEVNVYQYPLESYLVMRSVWDPDYDTEKVISEYYSLMYAEAAAPMKEFFTEIEKIVMDPGNYPKSDRHIHIQEINWALGTHERMKKLDSLIRKAQKLVRDPDAKKRIKFYVDNIWKQALQGRKDYDQRLNVEKIPPHKLGVAFIGRTAVPTGADWKLATGTQEWWNMKECVKCPAGGETPVIKLACNDTDLFIRFEERSSLAYDFRKESKWTNGVEIFLGLQAGFPYYQLAVSPAGKTFSCYYKSVDGTVVRTRNAVRIKLLENSLTAKSWTFVLQVPIKDIELTAGKPYYANFIRNRHTGTKKTYQSRNVAWSYIPDGVPCDSCLYRMGQIYVPPVTGKYTPDIKGSFRKIGKDGMPAGWVRAYSPRKECISVENGSVTLHAGKNSYVQIRPKQILPVRYGDILKVSCKVSGTGKASIYAAVYYPAKTSVYYPRDFRTLLQFPVTETPEQKTFSIPLKMAPKAKDLTGMYFILMARQGKVTFSDVSLMIEPGK